MSYGLYASILVLLIASFSSPFPLALGGRISVGQDLVSPLVLVGGGRGRVSDMHKPPTSTSLSGCGTLVTSTTADTQVLDLLVCPRL